MDNKAVRLLTINELVKLTGKPREHWTPIIHRGELRCIRFAQRGHIHVLLSDLERYLKSRTRRWKREHHVQPDGSLRKDRQNKATERTRKAR